MMTFYAIVLFCHIAATLLVAAALAVEFVSINRLRQSASCSEVKLWVDLAPRLPVLLISSVLILLLSGIYMTGQIAGWSLAWPKMAVIALVLIAPFGAVTGRKMRAIRRACLKGISAGDVHRLVRDPLLGVSFYVRSALFFGIVFLMTEKPVFGESLSVVIACLVFGAATGMVSSRTNIG